MLEKEKNDNDTIEVKEDLLANIHLIMQDFNASSREQYRQHILSTISNYEKQSSTYKTLQMVLQLPQLIGAGIALVLIIIPAVPRWIPAIVGAIVTLAAGVIFYFRFYERHRDCALAAAKLRQELDSFDAKQEQYTGKDETTALETLLDRTEDLVRKQPQAVSLLKRG